MNPSDPTATTRAERETATLRWRLGPAELHIGRMRLTIDGVDVELDRSSVDVLTHLLQRAGEVVPKDDLLRAGWPARVVSENSLAKAIGRLRQALNDPEGKQLRVVHGYGYKLVADVERLPPASGAGARDAEVESALPAGVKPPRATSRRRGWLAATLLLVALAALLVTWSRYFGETSAPIAPASIAVLPFVDLSAAQDQGYFSDGLAEQLIDSLARLPQLRVAARTSSFAYRDRRDDIPSIGRALNVATVLEGSVRRAGERIRVTTQLIDSANGYHLWSQTYDRPITELFAMQDDIARSIVGALSIELRPEQLQGLARHGTRSPEAFEQFKLAYRLFRDDETSHRRAIAAYERAVALDPDYVDAWFGLADMLGFSGLYADSAEQALAGKRRAFEIADRVIALAPERPEGYFLRGAYRYSHWLDWQGAEADLERGAALSSHDNPSFLRNLCRLRAATGRMDEALVLSARANEVDPMIGAFAMRGYHLTAIGRFVEAHDALTQAIRIEPLDEHAHYYLGLGELLQGRPERALAYFEAAASPIE